MPGDFIIRRPHSSAEWTVVKNLLQDYRREFDDDTCFTSFDEEMNQIEHLYAQPDKIKLIALDVLSNTIVGCVALRTYSDKVAEMKRLYVVPGFRGKHLGKILAEAILEEAQARGYQSMILDTMIEMKAAQALYGSLGFRVIEPYNHQDSHKVICFEKTL